jgi:hypothetical protein
MPMDTLMWADEVWKLRCIGWSLKYSLVPRKCHYTGKRLWFTLAYKGTAMITGPGTPVFEDRWCDRNEYLFLKIKGII